ncbi:pectate lyase [Rhizoctonia solani]|uniref:Pectate lyase n=1 Tax=Rhizoctonia solani TaxID=456999 RepID=A0A8H8SZB3_9AGAM|nr:pectate lyase [Rhizoctonia solani]QRW24146.1 pectate lyase [Rhizoctonia solani]
MVHISFATLTVIAGLLVPEPSSSTDVKFDAARTIKAGESFDGKNLRYHRGVTCGGQKEGGDKDAVFLLESGATLSQSSGTTTITGGGAKNADDKVIQHNGGGLVKIDSYCVQDFGKLYRSCGNCSTQVKREVQISNIIARNGKVLAGVNSNYGDVATIDTKTNSYTSVKSICNTYQGNDKSRSLLC